MRIAIRIVVVLAGVIVALFAVVIVGAETGDVVALHTIAADGAKGPRARRDDPADRARINALTASKYGWAERLYAMVGGGKVAIPIRLEPR